MRKLLKEKMETGRASLYGWHKQTLWSRDRHRFHMRENGRDQPGPGDNMARPEADRMEQCGHSGGDQVRPS